MSNPTLSGSADNQYFIEGSTAISLFKGMNASNNGVNFDAFQVQVTNVSNFNYDYLSFGGSEININNDAGSASNWQTLSGNLQYWIDNNGSTSTINFRMTGGGLTESAFETLLNSLSYRYSNANLSTNIDKTFSITGISDADASGYNNGAITASTTVHVIDNHDPSSSAIPNSAATEDVALSLNVSSLFF